VLDPGELVQQVVNLVYERFNLYYVGLFLVDESGQWAVLEAGTGGAGRQMLAQGHRLEVGGISMVGWCTANAQARIALDVGEEAVRFDNPLLPETRSEMALPLRSRGRVIGALDVQSTEPGAFSEGDIAVLQTMADQVAVAIDNARLLVETQASLEKMEALQRRYVREQWAEYVPARAAPSYERTQLGVTPLGDTVLPEVEQAMAQRKVFVQSDVGDGAEQAPSTGSGQAPSTDSGQAPSAGSGRAALVAPISLRGEIIGALGLHETENKRRWTDDEIALIEAVADQMALAIENARLFEQVQSRAARERLIREITDRVRGAVDVESILQTTVQEVGKALGASHGLVRLGTKMELGDTSDESISKEGSQGRGVGGT
jgi:GAF domain-containing protein